VLGLLQLVREDTLPDKACRQCNGMCSHVRDTVPGCMHSADAGASSKHAAMKADERPQRPRAISDHAPSYQRPRAIGDEPRADVTRFDRFTACARGWMSAPRSRKERSFCVRIQGARAAHQHHSRQWIRHPIWAARALGCAASPMRARFISGFPG
jgi:hypothetical protein